jgi:hypothetical protein
MDKTARQTQWTRRKAKQPKDGKNGKRGFIGGNIRYDRQNPDQGGNRTMGKARASRF